MRPGRAAVGSAVVGSLLAVAACTDAPADPAPGADVSGVRASVTQQRIDEGTRRIAVRLMTDAETTLRVRGVRLVAPAFEVVPMTSKDTDFAPGQTIDLTTTYGRADCGVADPAAGVAAELLVETGAEQAVVSVPMSPRQADLVRRLHVSACATQRLRSAVDISYGPFAAGRVGGSEVLVGTLRFRRPPGGSGETVVVDSLYGSVLFAFEPVRDRSGGVVTRVDPTEATVDVPVLIGSSGRCDEHARSQSTQTFLFSVYVEVGGAAEHREILVPPPPLQRKGLALLDRVC